MSNTAVLIGLAGAMLLCLALAAVVWARFIESFVARRLRHTSAAEPKPPPLEEVLAVLKLAVEHTQAPWFIRTFAALVFIAAALAGLGLLLAYIGLQF